MQAALDYLVVRHETLRTRYTERDGWITQEVCEPYSVQTRIHPFVAQPAPSLADFLPGLDPGLIMRAIIETDDGLAKACSLLVHHVASDARSMSILANDFGDHCAGVAQLDLTDTYINWVHRTRAACSDGELDRLRRYWADQVHDAPRLIEWPHRLEGPDNWTDRCEITLASNAVSELRKTAQVYGVSLFNILLASCYRAIGRLANANRLTLVVPVSIRDESASRSVGYFINTLPIILRVPHSAPAQDLCGEISLKISGARENRFLPFHSIVQLAKPARRPGRPPFGQVMVNFTRSEEVISGGNTIDVQRVVSQGSQYDVSVDFMLKGQDLTAVFRLPEYMSCLLSADEVRANFCSAVDEIVREARSATSREALD